MKLLTDLRRSLRWVHPAIARRGLLLFWWATVCVCLASCQRAPRNATELLDRLPRHWTGEIHAQGEGGTQQIAIEIGELSARDEHSLEFNHVRFQLFAGGEAGSEQDAAIRGTVRAPGGEIQIDQEGTEAGDMLKPGSFQGSLAGDLQSVSASWTTGFGQAATLKLHATSR